MDQIPIPNFAEIFLLMYMIIVNQILFSPAVQKSLGPTHNSIEGYIDSGLLLALSLPDSCRCSADSDFDASYIFITFS
jgi:hypothetical protein